MMYNTKKMSEIAVRGIGPPTSAVSSGTVFYIDTLTNKLYGPREGIYWPSHSLQLPLQIGINTDVIVGNYDPVSGDGSVGEYFISLASEKIFGPKTSGGWGSGIVIINPTHQTGWGGWPMPFLPAMNNMLIYGTVQPSINIGQEGDMYLDTANMILYGPKKNSTWPLMGKVVKTNATSWRTMIFIAIFVFLLIACAVAYYVYLHRYMRVV